MDTSSLSGYAGVTVANRGWFDISEVLKYQGYLGSVTYCDKEGNVPVDVEIQKGG